MIPSEIVQFAEAGQLWVLGLLLVLGLVLVLSKWALLHLLRVRHEPLWRRLGAPQPRQLILNTEALTSRLMREWVRSGQYLKLKDIYVSASATCYRLGMFVYLPVAVLYLATIVITGRFA